MTDSKASTDGDASVKPHDNSRRFVVGIIAVGLAVLAHSGWQLASHPISTQLLTLLALTATAGWFALRVPSMPISFSISDTFSTAAALLVGPAAGAVTAALDGLILSFRMQSSARTSTRVLFNVAAPSLAIWVAAKALVALSGPGVFDGGPFRVPRLFALLIVFSGLNFGLSTGLVATAVTLERGTAFFAVWREYFVGLWITYLGATFAAMLVLVLSQDPGGRSMSTPEALALIAPLPLILYVAFRHAMGRAQDQIGHLQNMNQMYLATIEALAQTIDAKDQVTHDHIRRVQENSVRLARALGVTDELEIQALKAASLLHDVGKISVPEHILNKPGQLSGSELEAMRRHAPVGADILSVIGFPYPVVPIVRHHHENWDGTGYPDGIAGDAIPFGARILSVVDCFDALTSDRPYRPRFEPEVACKMLIDRRGTMYDPRVVDAFIEHQASGQAEPAPPLRAPVSDPHAPSAPAAERPDEYSADGRYDLEVVLALGGALAEAHGVADIGRMVWTHLQPRTGASAFVLFLYEDSSDSLVPAYRAGSDTVAMESRVPVGDRLSGWVAATRQVVVNSDARLDLDPDVRDASRLQTALAVPMCADDRLGGVLALYSEAASGFTPAQQRLAEAIASVLAKHQSMVLVKV